MNTDDKKTEGEQKFFKVYNKVEMLLTKKKWFLVFGFSLSNDSNVKNILTYHKIEVSIPAQVRNGKRDAVVG